MNFETVTFTRKLVGSLLEELTPEQLYTIPKGFNNNIIWNIAHILITEQMLTYGLSGINLLVDAKFVKMYGKGSIPSTKVSKKEIEEIKTQLLPAFKQTEINYKKGIFTTFKQYPTSTGIVLQNIEDALQFNVLHEGIHIGIILSLKKLV